MKVIEKATLDTFMVSETDPWNISTKTQETMDRIFTQVSRICLVLENLS